MNYARHFRRLVLASLASLALFYALVLGTAVWVGRMEPGAAEDWRFVLAPLPMLALLLFVVAHQRFLARIDEYLRGHHLRALAGAFGFTLIYIGVLGAQYMYVFHGDAGGASESFLASLPFNMIAFYLIFSYWTVRREGRLESDEGAGA